MSAAEPGGIRANIFTVPFGTDFCDAVAAELLQKCGADPLGLSSATVLLPNNRAVKAMTEAFVRRASPGLLLPRMAAIGDLSLDEALGPMLDPLLSEDVVPAAIDPAERIMLLAKLVVQYRPPGQPVSPAEALRLARHLADMIDELDVEEVGLDVFTNPLDATDLQSHWQASFGQLQRILPQYRNALKASGFIGPAERRNMLLDRLSARLNRQLPTGPMIAAGITTAARAVARVLNRVALMPQGMVILPGVDLDMPGPAWEALGSTEKREADERPPRAQEAHPQFHLKLLLDRMNVQRSEISVLGPLSAKARQRAETITDIFSLPGETANWGDLVPTRKRLAGVVMLEVADSAEEARAIAVTVRGALETPGKRIAVVTPDRELAVRVAAQLERWGVDVDDSAGRPLLQTPNGTLILALAEAYAARFSPVSLLSVLKHPLVHAGEERTGWLSDVRKLDLHLRGPANGIGLAAIASALLAAQHPDAELIDWWHEVAKLLSALENADGRSLAAIMLVIGELAGTLTGNGIWKGAAGRDLAAAWESFAALDLAVVGDADRTEVPSILAELFGRMVVRPPYGGHPRVAIYGLLEARMQHADLIICGGLNEGTWPQVAQPDPWLAPAIRRQLGLAGLDRNIGLSAHDLSVALGAKEVLLTRARRDRGGPTVASRFLLRLKALLGDTLQEASDTAEWASLLDRPDKRVDYSDRPKPTPDAEQRNVGLSVTSFDQLKSDPYSFYAQRILRLQKLDPVGAEPSHAWRGTLVHDVLEKWFVEDRCVPEKLAERADALLSNAALDPTLRVMWQPRIVAGLRWIAEETARMIAEEGRELLVAERTGKTELLGVTISGRADRIDRLSDGTLAIVDYKTGKAPGAKQATAGFAMQLGLVGLMAEHGGIDGISGKATRFEYWSLAKDGGAFGKLSIPTSKKPSDGHVDAAEFVGFIKTQAEAALQLWIKGNEPFTAKLHPEYGDYGDYDQLMRRQEWDGRQRPSDEESA